MKSVSLFLPDSLPIDCSLFLNVWNLFDDVASSTGVGAFERNSREALVVYDKLFWGNNIRAVTPPGEHYVPAWTEGEIAELHRILGDGMALVRNAIRASS